MPLRSHTPQLIEVDVADRVFGDTLFKQRARFVHLEINQQPPAGGCTVLVRLHVSLYANVDGAYGDLITGKGISSYEVTLVADNNCAVDAVSGAVRYIRANETPEEWHALLAEKQEDLVLQGNWMESLMHNGQVEIGAMLRSFMLQADQAPFYKFTA